VKGRTRGCPPCSDVAAGGNAGTAVFAASIGVVVLVGWLGDVPSCAASSPDVSR
jgi:hypothetical protein